MLHSRLDKRLVGNLYINALGKEERDKPVQGRPQNVRTNIRAFDPENTCLHSDG